MEQVTGQLVNLEAIVGVGVCMWVVSELSRMVSSITHLLSTSSRHARACHHRLCL